MVTITIPKPKKSKKGVQKNPNPLKENEFFKGMLARDDSKGKQLYKDLFREQDVNGKNFTKAYKKFNEAYKSKHPEADPATYGGTISDNVRERAGEYLKSELRVGDEQLKRFVDGYSQGIASIPKYAEILLQLDLSALGILFTPPETIRHTNYFKKGGEIFGTETLSYSDIELGHGSGRFLPLDTKFTFKFKFGEHGCEPISLTIKSKNKEMENFLANIYRERLGATLTPDANNAIGFLEIAQSMAKELNFPEVDQYKSAQEQTSSSEASGEIENPTTTTEKTENFSEKGKNDEEVIVAPTYVAEEGMEDVEPANKTQEEHKEQSSSSKASSSEIENPTTTIGEDIEPPNKTQERHDPFYGIKKAFADLAETFKNGVQAIKNFFLGTPTESSSEKGKPEREREDVEPPDKIEERTEFHSQQEKQLSSPSQVTNATSSNLEQDKITSKPDEPGPGHGLS